MERYQNLNEVLNDLIRINNDRIEGYERAIKETEDKDIDLRAMFSRMTDESRQYASELRREVVKRGGDAADGSTLAGNIYRLWMDVKSAFSGKGRKAILENCEFGEDAAQKAYHAALESDVEMPSEIRQLIVNQKSSLKAAYDTIKQYRNLHSINSQRGSD